MIEYNYDFLTIYDGADNTSATVATYSQETGAVSIAFVSPGSEAFVHFASDYDQQRAGFEAVVWFVKVCESGSHNVGQSGCTPCELGTYNDGRNPGYKDSCAVCPTGRFASQPGRSACTACPTGTFAVGPQPEHHDNASDCVFRRQFALDTHGPYTLQNAQAVCQAAGGDVATALSNTDDGLLHDIRADTAAGDIWIGTVNANGTWINDNGDWMVVPVWNTEVVTGPRVILTLDGYENAVSAAAGSEYEELNRNTWYAMVNVSFFFPQRNLLIFFISQV